MTKDATSGDLVRPFPNVLMDNHICPGTKEGQRRFAFNAAAATHDDHSFAAEVKHDRTRWKSNVAHDALAVAPQAHQSTIPQLQNKHNDISWETARRVLTFPVDNLVIQ